MDPMVEKFKKHDWFYEYLEDGNQWREGAHKHHQLIAEVRKLPMNQAVKLLDYVPAEVREKFTLELGIVCGGS